MFSLPVASWCISMKGTLSTNLLFPVSFSNDTGNNTGNLTAVAFDNTGHIILGFEEKIFKYEKLNDCYYFRKNRIIDNYNETLR